MMLYVVRHAHAGDRAGWNGSDRHRPLSRKGRRQAAGIAAQLGDAGIRRLVSSPAVRCLQTLEPLAARLGAEVEEDDRLAEGSRATGALALADEACARDEDDEDGPEAALAICSHGDVIPDLLRSLRDIGARIDDPLVWPKASTWVVGFSDGHWAWGRYLAPPTKA